MTDNPLKDSTDDVSVGGDALALLLVLMSVLDPEAPAVAPGALEPNGVVTRLLGWPAARMAEAEGRLEEAGELRWYEDDDCQGWMVPRYDRFREEFVKTGTRLYMRQNRRERRALLKKAVAA